MEAMAYELQDRLMSMGPEQTQAFHILWIGLAVMQKY